MKSLIILTNFDFDNPSGAAWSRVLNYAKALAEEQIVSILLSSKYDYSKKLKKKKIGENIFCIEGNKICLSTTFEDFHFIRYLIFIKRAYHHFKSTDCKRYLLYNSNLASVLTSLLYLRIYKKQKIYIEKNELRTAIALNIEFNHRSLVKTFARYLNQTVRILSGVITDFLAVFFSGILVISTRFENLYRNLNKHVIRIPILIDPSDISRYKPTSTTKKNNIFRIGYLGWIGEKKDGIFSLVEVTHKLSNQYPIELHLFGLITKSNKDILYTKIDNKIVYYHGNMSRADVTKKLIEHDLLALIRPRNLQTNFGFSTKLGDYLLSGVPVLGTNVSDNELYLKDGENAFIFEVGSKIKQVLLEKKLLEIISNHRKYLNEIGYKGKETAINKFSYYKYKAQINFFFWEKYK